MDAGRKICVVFIAIFMICLNADESQVGGGDIDSTNLTLTNPQNTTDTNHTKITLLPPQKQKSGGFFWRGIWCGFEIQ